MAHSNHAEEIIPLKRIEGQIRGIQKMINEKKYCVDILTQLRSAGKALLSVEERVLKRHMEGCVKSAVKSKSDKEINKKLGEIMTLVKRFIR